MQAATDVHRGGPRRGNRSRAPFSKFHRWLREDVSTRSETAQNPKRNHPPPSFPETSRLRPLDPPRRRGARSYRRRRGRRQSPTASTGRAAPPRRIARRRRRTCATRVRPKAAAPGRPGRVPTARGAASGPRASTEFCRVTCVHSRYVHIKLLSFALPLVIGYGARTGGQRVTDSSAAGEAASFVIRLRC